MDAATSTINAAGTDESAVAFGPGDDCAGNGGVYIRFYQHADYNPGGVGDINQYNDVGYWQFFGDMDNQTSSISN
jgi:hypothetical protein